MTTRRDRLSRRLRLSAHALGSRSYAVGTLIAAAFTATPFAGFLDRNREEIASAGEVMRYGALGVGAALALLTIVVLATGRFEPAAAGAVIGATAFLAFQWSWFSRGPLVVQYAQWLVASAAGAWLVARVARSPNGRLFLGLLAVGLLAAPALSYASWRARDSGASAAASPAPSTTPVTAPPGEVPGFRPNVWFFVLDGYGRADQLQRVLDHDDDAFAASLAERGFTVRDDAFASYPATFLSVGSMLETAYVATSASGLDGGHRTYYPRLQGDNASVRTFRQLGYRYVHAESGTYVGTQCNEAYIDLCLPAAEDTHGPTLDETEFTLLRLTPVRPLLDAGLLPLGDSFTDPPRVVEALHERDPAEPYFVFAHVVAPHAPYRRQAGCDHRSRNVGAIGEGWESSMRDDYLAALTCLQSQTLEAVDTILRDDPDAVVVLTGDHGTAFTVDFEQPLSSWTPDQIAERFSVFHAVHLPARCAEVADAAASDPAAAGVVNSLELARACIEERAPDLLPPRAFLYRYGEHEIVEIDPPGPPGARPAP